MSKSSVTRKLLPLLLALALSQTSFAAPATQTPSKRDPEVIQAEMKALGARMAKLANELQSTGSTDAYAFRITPEGISTDVHTLVQPMQSGAAIGVVLSERAGGGVEISAVTPGSGAEKAGLQAGDQLLAVRGKALAADASVASVRGAIGALKAGDRVALSVKRGAQTLQLNALASEQPRVLMLNASGADLRALQSLEELKNLPRVKAAMERLELARMSGEHGARSRIKMINSRGAGLESSDLDLAKLNPGLASYFGTNSGVLTLAVEGYAPMLAGDVITRVNNVVTETPEQVFEQFRAMRGKTAEVAVIRQKAPRNLSVKVPESAMGLPPPPPPPPPPPAPPAPPAVPTPPPPPPSEMLAGVTAAL